MINPFDKLQEDVYNDIISRCRELDIIKIDIEPKNTLRYTSVEEIEDIDFFTIVVKTNPFENEDQFWEYLTHQMKNSIYFNPLIQNWYIVTSNS